jgi:hypothetical protein
MSALQNPRALFGFVTGVSVLAARKIKWVTILEANQRRATSVASPPRER